MANYIFTGRIRGSICTECMDILYGATVRLYRHRENQNIPALIQAEPKHTFTVLFDADIENKERYLIAETSTDKNGEFCLLIRAEDDNYAGEPFEVDVFLTSIPGRRPGGSTIRVQFTITSLQPEWKASGNDLLAPYWDYIIPARYWCQLFAYFDHWVICGKFVTCEGKKPLPGATIRAFDADWFQHDSLGEAITDFNGRFRIDYTSADFKKTPFSPWINIEFIGGPDIFFQAEFGGSLVINESASMGRQPGRENSGHCFCIELCTDQVQPPDAEELPHWERVEEFDISSEFSPEGYAGSDSLVMHDCIDLHGNMPLKNIANGKPLKYRFLIGAWTWPGGEDPAVLPNAAPADIDLVPVTSICDSKVGYLYYSDAFGDPRSAPVILRTSDLDGDGCLTLLGKSVQVDMHDGTTGTIAITEHNFVGAYLLMTMNSHAHTPAPYDVLQHLGLPAAGTAVPVAERAPIRRFKLRFQVFDADEAVDKARDNRTLDALVIDNSPVKYALNLTELTGDLCNKITNNVHILYTLDHPHLRSFNVTIENNAGILHPPPPLPQGIFSGGLFFRGGESGGSGVAVNVAADPVCAYAVKLSWQTRHYQSNRGQSRHTQILYCK
ncbi:MAG: hypothetical protein PHI97_01440 [Desulfobulbus sp.]|nr:hypothetical protein [Desulfobulbus sp.]